MKKPITQKQADTLAEGFYKDQEAETTGNWDTTHDVIRNSALRNNLSEKQAFKHIDKLKDKLPMNQPTDEWADKNKITIDAPKHDWTTTKSTYATTSTCRHKTTQCITCGTFVELRQALRQEKEKQEKRCNDFIAINHHTCMETVKKEREKLVKELERTIKEEHDFRGGCMDCFLEGRLDKVIDKLKSVKRENVE